MRKLSIVTMLLVWVITSTILIWGLTAKIDFLTLILLYVVPYVIG